MGERCNDIAVAGHICADLIPQIPSYHTRPEDLVRPGRLAEIGPLSFALGGVVGNTGLALHRLGIATALMGKTGDDLLGNTIRQALVQQDPALADGMIVAPDQASSYTIVISLSDVDRSFLHCMGANDTFLAHELDLDRLGGAQVLHFGYPPLMRGIYSDGGNGLVEKFGQAQRRGMVVSLDMAMPDPASPAGQVDWLAWMARVLPEVDVFMPSLDEVLLMLDPPCYDDLVDRAGGENPAEAADSQLLEDVSARLLGLGPRILVLKLGNQGLYLRTGEKTAELAERTLFQNVPCQPWRNRQLLAPCFEVDVVGATGSGDCTIAGFLAGLVGGQSPTGALLSAVGVGACSVQSADATSGIPRWSTVQERIASWQQKPLKLQLDGWRTCEDARVYVGPQDEN